ncbi:thiamine pyrophosphate-requiring enzyme [Hahella chejuensis KCTC 2396]|uniref:Thiamine pyrophosphate-requiring enzyme n=1 Tax=Hahella chejuensis (strain KCTC 2396) TaxID=349521 RepID=Q2SM62_HAHCH|nr:thiamine pyrophosphate-binding protein [Hahella chejuensis]ABC28262.1 thiamine pyrophosphate-requiring enzyme [Hahella chejuensis KCTC 2396]
MESKPLLTQTGQANAISCAELIVKYLSLLKVPYVFGVSGGNIDPLGSALARHEDNTHVRWILTRSEAGAGFMADGFARESGVIGVCSATSGPGCTNLLTPVSNAFVDSVPMLVITGQSTISTFGRGAMQESSASGVDTILMFKGCTRYNTLVSHPEQLEHNLLAALSHATGPTPGPVHISIPLDIFETPVPSSRNPISLHTFLGQEITPDKVVLQRLNTILRGYQRGVIVIGNGCAGAMREILCYAERRAWPIVTTPMGRGLMSADHPLYRGVFGTAGHESARKTLTAEEADIIMVVCANLDEHATCGWDGSTILSRRLVHINNNPEHLAKSHMAQMNLMGSPRIVFDYLNQENQAAPAPGLSEDALPALRNDNILPQNISVLHIEDCNTDTIPINPRRLFWRLSQCAPKGVHLYADAGNAFFWATHYWHPRSASVIDVNKMPISMGFAAMGWAIGAAIGGKFANPHIPVLCITGDGSYLMTAQEITVAKQHNLNVVILVLNNGVLGTVMHGQRMRGMKSFGNELPQTNFAILAQSMGVESYRIRDFEELVRLDIESLFLRPGPVLLDILVDKEVPPPIGQRVKNLEASRPAPRAPTLSNA